MNDENKITPQPEYDALYAFDAENNVEPASVIAERIAAKYGFHDKHPIVDDIHYAIEDAIELGQRRGKLIPPPGSNPDLEMPPEGYSLSRPAGAGPGETPRCEICDWPLAKSQDRGCVPGDCSYRPDDPVEQERIRKRRVALSHSRPVRGGE